MIGLAILAIRTATPPSLIPETFGPSRIHVPKAPALGLLLLEPQYVEYNKRIEESNKKLSEQKEAGTIDERELSDGKRDPLETSAFKERIDAFKQEEIYKKMWALEEKDATYVRVKAAFCF